MGWVVEQAGGKASTGAGAMLDQQVGVFCGLFDYAQYHESAIILQRRERRKRQTAGAGYHCSSMSPGQINVAR